MKMRYTHLEDFSLAFIRMVVASIFLFAAYAKIFFWFDSHGLSGAMLWLIKFLSIVEPLGALALLLGFLTRFASIGLAIIMIGAIFFLRFSMGASFFTSQQGIGFDYNALILACCINLIAFGAGRWSLDHLRFVRKS